MINNGEKQAILILTNGVSKDVIKSYGKLREATAKFADVFLLLHVKGDTPSANTEGVKIETFTNEVLTGLGYTPIRQTLVPGSNHFPVLQFFLKHPGYKYYWCIEDDVVFSGSWNVFFENISQGLDYDFITSHIRKYSDLGEWRWWRTLNGPDGKPPREDLVCSFNPIYRISAKALEYIDKALKAGHKGHHEVLLPSLLHAAGFTMADFGTKDNNLTPSLSYCTLTSMRWKPVFFLPGWLKNKLYHPVKSKITFEHVIVFIKRNLRNQTEYFK